MADEATETPTTDAADVARAQAEARRRRILEQAQTRMGVVSGEVTQDEEEKQQSASKAARIRAARARRYGKKSTATATTTTEGDSAAPASETPEKPKEETPATNDQPPKSEPTPEPAVADFDDDEVPADEKAADTAASVATSQASDDTGTKKKYLGVAKMRRKMIQKKKMEAEEAPKDEVTDAKETPFVPPTTAAAFSPIPVYMHFFTLLLLFLAGLDVGFQQYHPNVQVDTQFVVAQHGLPLVHRSLMPPKPKPDIVIPDEVNLDEAGGDEFEEPEVEEVISNIDPIFRVDLDQLTQGPGFFNQIGRAAVGAHRAILALFALPLTIFQSVIGMPQALLRFPPILCVLALIIRQLIGKLLLGASIPETETKSKGTDALEMAKNFVSGFLKSSFPTFVGMYDAFSHLRSDMYVILFGVFCGFIMGHWQPVIPATGTDEL
eukprot:Nitzschia sp. Nitz4//scaffold2_size372955//209780//211093//NITZ4_000436-RA/size372955-processed-gene-0.428-mRNA-1//1//CDS//3329546817//715//frame0